LERLAVLASGRGSGFQAIIDHIKLDILNNVKVVLLISNNSEAYAIDRARENSVKVEYIEGLGGKKFQDTDSRNRAREEFDSKVLAVLRINHITLVSLAGFNQIISPVIIDEYNMKIMNIHPAYDMQKYGGVGMIGDRVHGSVLANKEKFSGCTVHYVDYKVDRGPIIINQKVPIMNNDTIISLSARVLVWEHRTYPKAIQIHIDNEFGRRKNLTEDELINDAWEMKWNLRQENYLEFQKRNEISMYGDTLRNILGEY